MLRTVDVVAHDPLCMLELSKGVRLDVLVFESERPGGRIIQCYMQHRVTPSATGNFCLARWPLVSPEVEQLGAAREGVSVARMTLMWV